ncbi:hypothetical protein [Streptomyces beijiangensis]|uniref:Lipoprotein n=1 Tax=Streptomyces beijiangensis TaxID=163361 RepID=A0A939JK67_9ACTN|nr:hypothetical protein [Streptomyces beijiangensis]MBO0517308.1 hypothetical protein [Streptomyces beijiangensis]
MRNRAALALAGIAALCAVATGCGIRDTSVPVDAGQAPSRVPCDLPAENVTTQAMEGIPVRIYLVCGSQLVSADRTVQIPQGAGTADRIRVAQLLLNELEEQPTAAEKAAGFTTDVRGSLTVQGPYKGDPKTALRLNRVPDDLPSGALAQVVCTYAESALVEAEDGAVVLGGPSGEPTRAYACTQELKSRPDSVPALGEPTPSPAPTPVP